MLKCQSRTWSETVSQWWRAGEKWNEDSFINKANESFGQQWRYLRRSFSPRISAITSIKRLVQVLLKETCLMSGGERRGRSMQLLQSSPKSCSCSWACWFQRGRCLSVMGARYAEMVSHQQVPHFSSEFYRRGKRSAISQVLRAVRVVGVHTRSGRSTWSEKAKAGKNKKRGKSHKNK